MTALTSAQSRALALLLLAVLLGLVYFIAIHPLLKLHQDNVVTIEQLNTRLIRYQQLASRRSSLEQHIASIEQNQNTEAYYLKNQADALAAAELQSRINKVVSVSGGSIISTQPLNSVSGELLPRVRVRVRFRGNIEALRKIVYSLETGTPLLFVDEFSVSAKGRHIPRKAGKVAARHLDVQFEISGYIRPTNT